MRLDDSIIRKYLAGESPDSYRDSWIYSTAGTGCFQLPDPAERDWVSRLRDKLTRQIAGKTVFSICSPPLPPPL